MPNLRLIALAAVMAALTSVAAAQLMPGDPDRTVLDWRFSERSAQGWAAANALEPLDASSGTLRTRARGGDANMAVRPKDIDAGSVSHFRVRMRSTQAGSCQLYFATSGGPDPSANDIPIFQCPGDNRFRTFEVRLTGLRGWTGRLEMLRLDPVNGGGESAEIEFEWMALVCKAPRLAVRRFAANLASAPAGTAVMLTLDVANVGGPLSGALAARLGTGAAVRSGEADGVWRWTWPVRVAAGGGRYTAQVGVGEQTGLMAECVVAPRGGPVIPIGGGLSRAELAGRGPVSAAWLAALASGKSVRAALCTPLSSVVVARQGRVSHLVPAFRLVSRTPRSATLQADLRDGLGAVRLRFDAAPGKPWIDCDATFTAGSALQLLRFGAPTVLAGEGGSGTRRTGAILPGLEYLGAAGRSSDTESVGESLGLRTAPLPYQITVPLATVATRDALVGLLWDARATWAPGHAMPMAEFASPNFLDGQANHLAGLFVPSAPEFGRANERASSGPGFDMAAGQTVRLRCKLLCAPRAEVVDAVPLWYRAYGQPAPPRTPKPLSAFMEDVARGWTETCRVPGRGYVNHWRTGEQPGPRPDIEANVLDYALRHGKMGIAATAGLSAASRPDLALPSLQPGPPPAAIATQAPDGTWPYVCTPDVAARCREFTGGKRSDLGRAGTSCVGLCAVNALPILQHALATGDPASVRSGLKALHGMMRFDVPAGSQTWEVHKDIPDIYAAAVATDCYRIGYELTGERKWLERARYWARTGLPFLYSYQAPGTGPGMSCVIPEPKADDPNPGVAGAYPGSRVFTDAARHPTPYGSIPVFGTSFYVVTWFGNLVQWCGLCWAQSVQALLRHVDDPVLRPAVAGVVASGCNQTFDKAPVTGLLPDTWHLGSNTILPAFISPIRLEGPLRTLLGEPRPADLSSDVLRGPGGNIHLTTRGRLSGFRRQGDSVAFDLAYHVGWVTETVISGIAEPRAVRWGSTDLPRTRKTGPEELGWRWSPGTRRLTVRQRHTGEDVRVIILMPRRSTGTR